ncbi:Kelch repeat-containing protein 3 [Exophiala xenobiotica]|uniref:Kelch repeat-containing protein 3 n=1 Tax=Lithohypha guttulata TaxID=1690604 RepID=A0ABR0JYU1_9EURO|nr:Kelch repeat-containing protein 3 [Lithohypha guttulata]KAK5317594.1 Kelch repeat-containing protein 3 [Exophiala xenobiotica]
MAKDKKKKSAEQKASKLAKQSKKNAKGEKKVKAKTADADSDADENADLDAVLAAYAEQQAKFLKVTEQPCGAPSSRSAATFIASPSSKNELLLFGGEYYDGLTVSFYNDLFVYQINQGEWRHVTSPNSPLPRSGHAWCRGGNTGGIYLFGGEFSSPKQGTFYHYNDFWYLDPDTREWTRLESKGKNKSPPARSGHRMTYWKNFVLLFGGFQDTSQQTKYLQDTWVYDTRENVWHEFKLPPASQKPDARSSFSLLPHESGVVLFGGYSRVKALVGTKQQSKAGPQRNVLKPMLHQDSWFLRLTSPASDAPPGTPPIMRWERRKRPANVVNPPRAGITMAYHKGRGLLFGGVHDVEASEEGIESEFFQDLYIYNTDRNRMFPLALRRPKTAARAQTKALRVRNRGKADEEELLRNLAALETTGAIVQDDDTEMGLGKEDDESDSDKKVYPVKFEFPHSRFNALLTVQEDTLFIYGGTFERKDVEVTFSDLYAIDLNRMDGVKELYYVEPVNMNAVMEDSEEEGDDDDDEDMDLDEDDSEASDVEEVFSPSTMSEAGTEVTDATASAPDQARSLEVETEKLASQDPRPFPRPFESRADFFRRTTNDWQKSVLDYVREASNLSIKELRERAFQQAEERWWDCREEVQALEDEQEAAGIGDVVSLNDRAEAGGGGRRR